MARKPHPRHFTHEEAFVSASMDFAERDLDAVTQYDSHQTATKKRAAIAQAREDAREDARDDWDAWLECATEAYERGVGPAWD